MKEKAALITGASSGIGRAAAIAFAESGANVIAVGRNENALAALSVEADGLAGTISSIGADISDPDQIDRVVSEAVEKLGRIDILVNAAGIIQNGSIADTTLEDWDKMLNINVRSVFYLIQRCVPELEKAKGNIVNVSSVTGTRAFPGVLAYCVSKAAVDQLTRCCALELAPKGIRVNAVNPGVVVTNLHKRGGMSEEKYETFLEHSKKTHPIGRPGEASEVAELIRFLASDNAGWITGVTYAIDGGRAETCAR
ncbi:MAG: SDR family oxidoreductase [Acidobacteria bacterium]|nr:SDR family oxidoreductase [Acidobacteriota bacterium]